MRFKITLNICSAELLITRIFFLACLLQGQSTCPCCGGSCPQPCFTAPSERSKFSIETWGYGWKTQCISKSCSSSAGTVSHQLWGLHRPYRRAVCDSLTDSSLLQTWSETFVLTNLLEAWMLHVFYPMLSKRDVLYVLTNVKIHCFLVGERFLFSSLWAGRVKAFPG